MKIGGLAAHGSASDGDALRVERPEARPGLLGPLRATDLLHNAIAWQTTLFLNRMPHTLPCGASRSGSSSRREHVSSGASGLDIAVRAPLLREVEQHPPERLKLIAVSGSSLSGVFPKLHKVKYQPKRLSNYVSPQICKASVSKPKEGARNRERSRVGDDGERRAAA